MNLEKLLKNSSMPPKWLIYSLLFLSLIGFLDADYITIKHYLGVPLTCSIFEGCEKVTTSQYATVGNIPVALFGAVYYLSILVLVILYLDTGRVGAIRLISRFSVAGFLASLWFIYLQLFVIGAICFYCMVSAVTSTSIFIVGMRLMIKEYKNN
ncbi:MAG: hypothetical protein A3G49_06175 [Candidatus Sungbacteria bacterium RIFCSPLOWO2_12_FULL_41_11]|uniref:Vitamin K epoxide reductase domain-containing protein n=1 Tax=Candidatus Sungbacteria bacterium RIFCSPLOWO2_12_FULL_41_11 TaxID=1802286 RepID=A0A1G2LQX3_9BACT|nr:MAG: Vitamin K epoxide reductase [Parcubacteria group bacterium GW2011_GWA2_42_14]OHA14020.1 MAG: hypothetical protein A3G49_06175 [Candidatus Sungbacteria bacterium RIFCSPLOWO2_12_FULL_41_11]